VDADERTEIAVSYLKDHVLMADVAAKHHISAGLVGRICRDYSSGGAKIGIKKRKEESSTEAK